MNLRIFAVAICVSILSWATPTRAQLQTESQADLTLPQLPSSLEQLTKPSQIKQFQRLIQQQPLLYLFLQLQETPPPNLQQQTEAQLRQILQQPPSLQQQLFQQQVHGRLRLDDLGGNKLSQ